MGLLSDTGRRLRQSKGRPHGWRATLRDVRPAAPAVLLPVVTAMRQSRDKRMEAIERIRSQVDRIVGGGSMTDLERLSGALSLYERRIEQQHAVKGGR